MNKVTRRVRSAGNKAAQGFCAALTAFVFNLSIEQSVNK